MKGYNLIDELERKIHEAEYEAYQAREDTKKLENKLTMLEDYLGIKLIDVKRYEKVKEQ